MDPSIPPTKFPVIPQIPLYTHGVPTTEKRPWYLWPNLLSLDAPIVALVWCALLAKTQQIALLPSTYLCLFGTVWIVYVADRLLDARSSTSTEPHSQETARLAFYRQHGHLFLLPLLISTALCIWAAGWWLPSGLLQAGILLSVLVLVYLLKALGTKWHPASVLSTALFAGLIALFAFHANIAPTRRWVYIAILATLVVLTALQKPTPRKRPSLLFVPKEFFCGILFALGTFLPVQFYLPGGAFSVLNPITYLFALLCGLNCLAIACYEHRQDATNDPSALPQRLPAIRQSYPLLLLTLLALAISLHLIGIRSPWQPILIAIASSTALLFLLHLFSKKLSPNLLRTLTDTALLTPLAFLI